MKRVLVVVILALVYIGGYYDARSNGFLIHRSAYFNNGAGAVSTASRMIVKGDFVGSLQPRSATVAAIAHIGFTPLRWLETGYWYYAYPKNVTWPYEPKNVEQRQVQ